jgi:glucose-1-phosphate cytidylyltransferase
VNVKAIILAGGFGTRLSEETTLRPKPMVEIGDKPILWHIMKLYSAHGITEFIVCCGYKAQLIKQYFANYYLHTSDVTFDLRENRMEVHKNGVEPWRVTLIDTGEATMTGGRLKRVREFVGRETFCLTYGDGVSDINIADLIKFHRQQKSLATLTAVQPPGRFGTFKITAGETRIRSFREKAPGDGAWVNGGYFVLEPAAIDYIKDDSTVWEDEPLRMLARESALTAYRHTGFWHPMDTLRDKNVLEELWASGNAPWKVW